MQLSLYTEHAEIIKKRWPKLLIQLQQVDNSTHTIELIKEQELSLVFDNIQIASSYDQYTEAHVQLKVLEDNITSVTLYGSGLGTVANILIEDAKLATINIIILNISLFKVCLSYFEQKKWLSDHRVNLSFSDGSEKISKNFVALPAELTLASNESSALRDRVCLALDHQFIETKKGESNKQLQQQIIENIPFIKKDKDIKSLFLSGKNKQYIVCGAGPTLEEHYSILSQQRIRDNYTLIAVDAAVLPLTNYGIMPDIIVSIDPIAKKLFDDLDMTMFKSIPLIYFPIVQTTLLTSWQGPRFTAYSTGKLYNGINHKYKKGRLYCGGSVIHPAIDLAVKMGAKNVSLLGADFSFPGGKSHTHWQEEKSTTATHISSAKASHWVLNSFNERVPTLLNYRGYLRDLEDYISYVKHVDFYNGSKKGAKIKGTKIWQYIA